MCRLFWRTSNSGQIKPLLHSLAAKVARISQDTSPGLLTEYPYKNNDTIAQVVLGTSESFLQELENNAVWDENAFERQRVEQMAALPTESMAC